MDGNDPIVTDPNTREFDKIRWRFKIGYASGNHMMFGITSERSYANNDQNIQHNTHFPGNYYLRRRNTVTSHNNKGSFHGPNGFGSYESGDTITMQLDLVAKTLSFWNDKGSKGNDKYEGIAFKDIDVKNVKEYYLAITLCYQKEVLTLEECKVFNPFPNATSALKQISLLYDAAIDESMKLYQKINPIGGNNNNNNNNDEKPGARGVRGVKFNDVIKISQKKVKKQETVLKRF